MRSEFHSTSSQIYYIITSDDAYIFLNHEEVDEYNRLPFYKKWVTKKPIKDYVSVSETNKELKEGDVVEILVDYRFVGIMKGDKFPIEKMEEEGYNQDYIVKLKIADNKFLWFKLKEVSKVNVLRNINEI